MPDSTGHESRGRDEPSHRGRSINNWLAQEASPSLTDRFVGGERMQEIKAGVDEEKSRGGARGCMFFLEGPFNVVDNLGMLLD